MKYLFLMCALASSSCFAGEIAQTLDEAQVMRALSQFDKVDPSNLSELITALEKGIDLLRSLGLPEEEIAESITEFQEYKRILLNEQTLSKKTS